MKVKLYSAFSCYLTVRINPSGDAVSCGRNLQDLLTAWFCIFAPLLKHFKDKVNEK